MSEPNIGGDCEHGYPSGHNCPECETQPASEQPTVSPQKSLSVLLDEIELHVKLFSQLHSDHCDTCKRSICNNAALVKALRRARAMLEEASPGEHQLSFYEVELAQLLSASVMEEEKQ